MVKRTVQTTLAPDTIELIEYLAFLADETPSEFIRICVQIGAEIRLRQILEQYKALDELKRLKPPERS